jgi:putative hydrolase of HD superfamily
MEEELKNILDFINQSEKLKRELRHSWLSDKRRESVAEHTWRMSLMAVLLRDKLGTEVNLERVLKIIITHDLVEIEAGDTPAVNVIRDPSLKNIKHQKERQAIENIRKKLGPGLGDEIYDLWQEFEANQTNEAKFANALDKLEVKIQHIQAPIETWEEIEFDMVYMMDPWVSFDDNLVMLKDLVVSSAEDKMRKNSIPVKNDNRDEN